MRSLAPCHGASALSAPCQSCVLGATSPEVYGACSGAIRLDLALALRVHRIRATWRDSEMTTKNNHPELIEKLADGISNLRRPTTGSATSASRAVSIATPSGTCSSSQPSATRQPRSQASTPGGRGTASSARERRPSGFSPRWSTRTPTPRRLQAKATRWVIVMPCPETGPCPTSWGTIAELTTAVVRLEGPANPVRFSPYLRSAMRSDWLRPRSGR